MTSAESGAEPAALLEGRFNGRTEFAGLIRQALTAAERLDTQRSKGVAGSGVARRIALKERFERKAVGQLIWFSGDHRGFDSVVFRLLSSAGLTVLDCQGFS